MNSRNLVVCCCIPGTKTYRYFYMYNKLQHKLHWWYTKCPTSILPQTTCWKSICGVMLLTAAQIPLHKSSRLWRLTNRLCYIKYSITWSLTNPHMKKSGDLGRGGGKACNELWFFPNPSCSEVVNQEREDIIGKVRWSSILWVNSSFRKLRQVIFL